MAVGPSVPSSDPIDMSNGRLRQEWRIFFNQLSQSVNQATDSTTGSIASLQTQITNEVAAREAADAQLLPKTGGQTGTIGFQGAVPTARLAVVGPRGGNHALQTLLIQLARYGLITDQSTP